jgi:hypothetical protein
LILVVVVAAARIRLVFFVGPLINHVFELSDGARVAATVVFEGATVVETVLEKVDDFLVGDIDYSGALVEKAPHVLAQGLALFLLHHV